MSKINNLEFYPIMEVIEGSTVTGSYPSNHPTNAGKTFQFDLLGIIKAVVNDIDFINFNKATRIGQHVVVNEPSDPTTSAPNINNGNRMFGTINTFPPTATGHLTKIVKFT